MRFHFLLPLFVASATSFTAIAAEPKFDPKEGWVQLFDGETTFGWTVGKGVEVKNGEMVIPAGQSATLMAWPTCKLLDFEMIIEAELGSIQMDQYDWLLTPKTGKGFWSIQYKRPTLKAFKIEIASVLKETHSGFQTNPICEILPQIAKHEELKLQAFDQTAMKINRIWFRPIHSTPLFDGKSLTGWKRFTGEQKREKSKFEVTKDGELHVTDGPGDLQTDKSFQNFILQVDCKTNGKNLNSGIFFRCLPGQYQQGYEAQIHNGISGTDRTKPIDFGTGAIYRRIASRKVVSNDDEWFTMTVMAQKDRFCTWVNGYPTVNWKDERPANANGRNGLKLEGGPISIQGHDPTTDLLFRNIRIVELK